MTDTTYVDFQAPAVNATWLNDVNNVIYRGIANGGAVPVTPAAVRTSLDLVSATTLATTAGASKVGYTEGDTGSLSQTLQAKARQVVALADFTGADPTGGTASDAALASALATGKAIDLGGPENNWLFNATTSYTGKVTIQGRGATVTTNQLFLQVTNGTGSKLSGFKVLPATIPYTLLRVPGTWTATVGQVVQSLNGYMPGAQDTDIWAGLSGAIQNQGNTIHPAIYFTVNSAAGASDLEITGISGSCLAIIVEGYSDARIHDNNFSGNNYTYGAILLLNAVPVNYKSVALGFTLPRGVGNKVYNNQIRYGTLCGIVYFGQDKLLVDGNETLFSGETGIKSYQYDGAAGPSATTACISTNCRVTNNHSYGNYYDGIDLQVFYGVSYSYYYCGTVVEGNISEQNRMTGFTSNGASMVFGTNHANANGTHGISVVGSNNTVVGNHARNNCQTGTTIVAQPFDIVIQGDDCVGAWNNISNASAPATYNYLHSGLSGANPTSSHEGRGLRQLLRPGLQVASPSHRRSPAASRVCKACPLCRPAATCKPRPSSPTSPRRTPSSATDSAISFFTSATCTVTLPSAATYSRPGSEAAQHRRLRHQFRIGQRQPAHWRRAFDGHPGGDTGQVVRAAKRRLQLDHHEL
jgi:hypothetical protein